MDITATDVLIVVLLLGFVSLGGVLEKIADLLETIAISLDSTPDRTDVYGVYEQFYGQDRLSRGAQAFLRPLSKGPEYLLQKAFPKPRSKKSSTDKSN